MTSPGNNKDNPRDLCFLSLDVNFMRHYLFLFKKKSLERKVCGIKRKNIDEFGSLFADDVVG